MRTGLADSLVCWVVCNARYTKDGGLSPMHYRDVDRDDVFLCEEDAKNFIKSEYPDSVPLVQESFNSVVMPNVVFYQLFKNKVPMKYGCIHKLVFSTKENLHAYLEGK